MDNSAQAYREKIESKILYIMEEKLKSGEMDAARAKEIAGYVLDTLKDNLTEEEMYQVVKTFDRKFPELISVVTMAIKEHIEKLRQVIAREVGKLLKLRRIEEAGSLLQKATNLENKL